MDTPETETPVEKPKTGLDLLREPFAPNQINELPKGTKAQNQCPANEKVFCKICGGWHHPKIKHLKYIGHAALTDRLLDADPLWNWEPMAFKDGLPAFDATGGLWIKLTVCGHTRPGYGHAEASSYKEIGSREKEVIGDALRNAAMRFGAALDLWHKGDLHPTEDMKDSNAESHKDKPDTQGQISDKQRAYILKIGKDNELTENETRVLVAFMAKKHGISNNHWQIAKLFIPETEFKKRLNEYLDAIEKNESNQ